MMKAKTSRNRFMLSAAIGALALSGYANAQDTTTPAEDEEEAATTVPVDTSSDKESRQEKITVTGSLLGRSEFTSTAPIQVITAEIATLEGLVDTAEILQGASVASGSTQINGNFGGFVVEGGTGVNTISLRGLGAQRSLVLFNGRRLGPAGTQGQVGAVDLNVIPDAVINRIDILKDGASSTYGSDAVAGVVNVITDRTKERAEINFTADQPFEEGGASWGVDGAFGLNWENGSAVLSGSYEKFEPLRTGDRDFLSCANDYIFSEDRQTRRDLLDRRPDGLAQQGYKCFNILADVFDDNNGGRRWVYDAALGRFRPRAAGVAGTAETPQFNPLEQSRTVIPETERISVYGTFDYDFGFAEAFADVLYNTRETEQKNWRQYFPFLSSANLGHPGNVANPVRSTFVPGGIIPGAFARPITIVPFDDSISIDYYSATGGLRGDFGSSGFLDSWDWELAVTTSKSEGDYGRTTIPLNRAVDDNQFITLASGASVSRPVARNVSDGAGGFRCEMPTDASAAAFSAWVGAFNTAVRNGVPVANRPAQPALVYQNCATTLNYFTRDFLYGNLTQAQQDFLFVKDEGNTSYTQDSFDVLVRGELFDLPAGAVGVALGAQGRQFEIDDQPGFYSRNNLQWGLSSAVQTKGDDDVIEYFGEIEVPLLAGVPLFEELTFNASARAFNYASYGTGDVSKFGLNWQVTPSVRLRATSGDSYRAPALYELFLGNLTSFAGQAAVDPCDLSPTTTQTNATIIANCTRVGLAGYLPFGSSAEVTTGGGRNNLAAETSDSKTLGLILTPTGSNISVALDYFTVEINDQIARLGSAAILGGCYSSPTFGTAGEGEPFCSLFVRDTNPASPRFNQILSVNDSYVNINSQTTRGLDLTARYELETKIGDFDFDVQGTWTFEDEFLLFSGTRFSPDDFNGEVGEPDFVANGRIRFSRGDWDYTWFTDFVSRSSNDEEFANGSVGPFATRGTGNFYFKQFVEAQFTHGVSARYQTDDWTLTAGIDNLFDEAPPYVSTGAATRRGNAALVSTQYDYRGRSAFVRVGKRF